MTCARGIPNISAPNKLRIDTVKVQEIHLSRTDALHEVHLGWGAHKRGIVEKEVEDHH